MPPAQEEERAPRSSGWVIAAFACVTLAAVNVFPPAPGTEFSASPNELSRFDLVVAVAERASFSIERELAVFGNLEDTSVANGRTFSNKPPGLSFAAIPVYLALRPVLGPAGPRNIWLWMYLLRLATVSLASVLALRAMARRLARDPTTSGIAPAVVFAVAFGTPFLVYARSFFSHAWTASLLFIAFDLIDSDEERPWKQALAGLLAGWAVLSEFPAAILAGFIFLAAARRGWRAAASFAVGALVPVLLLAVYNTACFGGPFRMSYASEWYATHTSLSKKFFGFQPPRLRIALAYLFSANRGLVFGSPFFLLLPLAAARLRRGQRGAVISLSAAAIFFFVLCGYENWHGGWALGSRYLLPALLLAAWPLVGIGNASVPARVAFGAFSIFSAGYFFLSGATFWFYPSSPPLAIRFYTTHWLAAGWWAPTLLGNSGAAWIAPAVVTALGGAAAALASGGGDRLRAIGIGAAGLCLLGLLCTGGEPRGSFEDRLTRARIFESFSTLDPGSRELRALAPEIRTRTDFALWQDAARRRGIVGP